MPLDPGVLAALAAAGGVITAKSIDFLIDRMKAKDTSNVGIRESMSKQSEQLFEQQGEVIDRLQKRVDEIEKQRDEFREQRNAYAQQLFDLRLEWQREKHDLNQKWNGEVDSLKNEITRLLDEIDRCNAQIEEFKNIIDEGLIVIDRYGNIKSYNVGAKLIFKYEASEVLGKNITMLMPERFKQSHIEGMSRYFTTGESRILGRTVDVDGRDKYGNEVPISLTVSEVQDAQRKVFSAVIRLRKDSIPNNANNESVDRDDS